MGALVSQKVYYSINTFNAGEVSQLIFNREDITKYKSSCRKLENAYPLVEGGAKKMPGTYYAGNALVQSKPCRLVPFQFSTAQGAVLEFSAGFIRIWEPTSTGAWALGLVTSGGLPIQLVTPYAQADLFLLDCGTQSADTLWIFHPSYPPACVERLGPSNWTYTTAPPGIPPVVPGDPAYRGTTSIISTAFADIGVPILQLTQTYQLVMVTASKFDYADRVYINLCSGMTELNRGEFFVTPVTDSTDKAVYVGKIDGGSSTQAGTILTVGSVSSGTILVGMSVTGANVTPGTVITEYLSGTGGTGTYQVSVQQLVASGTTMTSLGGFAYNLIVADAEGVLFTGSISGTTLTVTSVAAGKINVGVGLYFPGVVFGTKVTAYGTGTGGVGDYTINNTQSAGSQKMSAVPVASESYPAYVGGGFAVKVVPMFDTANNYPACGTFYQQRLCVAGTNNKPNTIYGSVVGDYPDFVADPNADDYAVQFTLVSTKLDQIVNMIGAPAALLLGTAGGVWALSAGSANTSLSQTSVNSAKQTTIGVGRIEPQLVGDAAVFVSRSTKEVMFLVYDFVSNQWSNYDLTRLNREITIGCGEDASGIVQTAFQSEPYPMFWAVKADGQLLGLVFNRQDQVYAWFRVNMLPGGGKIESATVISRENQEDQLVVEVQRTVNGQIVRYIEYFMPHELFGDLANAFFVHAGLQIDLGPAITITNITNANPCVVTAPGQNFANGSFVQIAKVIGDQGKDTGMWQVNQDKTEAYTVANTNTVLGTFELLGVDSTNWGTYIGGGTALPVTNEVTGMSYLMGHKVVAVGDKTPILQPTEVTADKVTFDYYCSQITIGLPYKVTIQPSNPVISSPVATTHGMKQKLHRVTISLYQSFDGKYGVDPKHMYDITYGPGTQGRQP